MINNSLFAIKPIQLKYWQHYLCLALTVFISIFAIVYSWQNYVNQAIAWNPWSIADWLVNYSGGFVRRGLGGEIFINLSHVTGVPANILVLSAQLFSSACFYCCFWFFLARVRIDWSIMLLIGSPAFFLLPALDDIVGARKEVLLFAIFGIWLIITQTLLPTKRQAQMCGLILSFFVLIHELTFFYIGYFCLALLQCSNWKEWQAALIRLCPIVIYPLLTLGVIAVASGDLDNPARCARLHAIGASEGVCTGALNIDINNVENAWQQFSRRDYVKSMINLAFSLFYPLFICVCLMRNHLPKLTARIVIGYLLCFGASLPLFLLALDWGRWLNIHITLIGLACLAMIKFQSSPLTHGKLSNKQKLMGLTLALAGSALTWHSLHCCQANFVQPLFWLR